MSYNNVNIHDLHIVWNNAFRHISNCCSQCKLVLRAIETEIQAAPWADVARE